MAGRVSSTDAYIRKALAGGIVGFFSGEIDWTQVIVDGTFTMVMEGVLWGVKNHGGITEGAAKTPVQGDPDFVGPLTSENFGRLEIISGTEPFSQSELNAARFMAEQGYDVVLRSLVGTRLDGSTSICWLME